MQPIRRLMQSLSQLASSERYLFTPHDLRALLPELSEAAFKTLLSRAVADDHPLERMLSWAVDCLLRTGLIYPRVLKID
jgi:hypothetical protein